MENQSPVGKSCTLKNWFWVFDTISSFRTYLFSFFLVYGQDLLRPKAHVVQLPDISAAPARPSCPGHCPQGRSASCSL